MLALVIGGTGTLGSHLVPLLLQDPQIERVRVLSRSEHRQNEMYERLKSSKVDFLLGDIRDQWRIDWAIKDCHQVYHLAATKRVEAAEYNTREAKSVNVDGTENVIHGILNHPEVEKAMFISSDKACAPHNFYGKTKALAEHYWIASNIGKHRTRFVAARYGNVFGSQGSVIQTWKKRLAEGKSIQVTNQRMTRFFIKPEQAARFVVDSMKEADGGEIFVPKMKSTTMLELGEAFKGYSQDGRIEMIEPRPGEKEHEVMINSNEVPLSTQVGNKFIIWPEYNLYPLQRRGDPINEEYSSATAEKFSQEELRELCVM